MKKIILNYFNKYFIYVFTFVPFFENNLNGNLFTKFALLFQNLSTNKITTVMLGLSHKMKKTKKYGTNNLYLNIDVSVVQDC
jgi:hypothetical protein